MNGIPGFPGYFATDDGRIWSTKRGGRFLRPALSRGYPQVGLRRDGRTFSRKVATLVALAFYGPRPEGLEVRHIDGDKLNSSARNLRYGTHSENMQDKIAHGTNHSVNKTRCPNGHDYDQGNTFNWAGTRVCRQCRADQRRAKYRRVLRQRQESLSEVT